MLDVETSLQECLQKYFGFKKFKGQQEAIIGSLLEGKDTFVIMPTGGGKSLCYQLPALVSEGTAIIISPLIALMKNQVDALRNFGNEEGIAHFLNSSLTKAEITKVKKDITDGKTKLLYVAPESLTKKITSLSSMRSRSLSLPSMKRIVSRNGDMISVPNTAGSARSLNRSAPYPLSL
jgi:ATP-dependent DNA helicase RecQ